MAHDSRPSVTRRKPPTGGVRRQRRRPAVQDVLHLDGCGPRVRPVVPRSHALRHTFRPPAPARSARAESACVFCGIVAGREPASVVYRSPAAIAFVPLGPVVPGHVLVIPTTHVPDAAADPAVSAITMAAAAVLAREHEHCNIITSRGEHATQTVRHLHLHVVPRRAADGLALPWTAPG